MKLIHSCLKSDVYLDEVLSDNQKALLHYNHRYLLKFDENIQICEPYYDSLAALSIVKNNQMIKKNREEQKMQEISELHKNIEHVTNMKLI